jgi:hypothetical protein
MENILIYPLTDNTSDLTNSDITSNTALSIKILSLIDNAGIRIYHNDT